MHQQPDSKNSYIVDEATENKYKIHMWDALYIIYFNLWCAKVTYALGKSKDWDVAVSTLEKAYKTLKHEKPNKDQFIGMRDKLENKQNKLVLVHLRNSNGYCLIDPTFAAINSFKWYFHYKIAHSKISEGAIILSMLPSTKMTLIYTANVLQISPIDLLERYTNETLIDGALFNQLN
jgi:hypothetical protein